MFLIITVEMGVRSLHRLKTSSGLLVSTSDAYYETITRHEAFCRQFGFGLCDGEFFRSQDIKLFAGDLVLAFVTGNFFDHKTLGFLQAIWFWPL